MMGKTHLLAGAAVALMMPDWGSAAGVLAGSVLPDLDAGPNALAANPFKVQLLNAPFRALAWLARKLAGHRGILHGWGMIAAWGLFLIQRDAALGGLAIGWTLHVLMDATTKRGIKLLGVRVRPPRWLAIRTGGWVERWAVRPVLVLAVGAMLFLRLAH